jgi:site-specific DNA recombinase
VEGLVARAYIRVSTEEQAVSGFSLAAQRERLESFALSQGWQLAAIYEDDGYSAKDTNRPALQLLLAEAQPDEVVLVYKLDRLTRSVLDLYDLMKRFEQRRLRFKSATEEFNTTTTHGRLMLTLVAVLAQWERETIAERVKMGRQKKAASGEWPGGPVPFGYTGRPGRVRAGRTLLQLVPDPERAHLVRELFDRYLGGQGVRALCLWLNDELGVRTAGGRRWQVTAVSRVLTNPIYCGDVVHGRRVGGPLTRVRGEHEPLVPRERFEAVQELFRRRRALPPRHATGAYPLAGVARCGVCGGPIAAASAGSRQGGYYYRCLRYVKGLGCGVEAMTSFPGPLAEQAVVALVDGLERPGLLAAFLAQCEEARAAGRAGAPGAEARRLGSGLQEAQAAIRRWDQAYESGRLELGQYLERVQPHKERLRLLEARLAAGAGPGGAPAAETGPPTPATMVFRQVWDLATPPERKALLLRVTAAYGLQILLGRHRRVWLVPGPA